MNILKIAVRNLLRHKRRTLLTSSLIAFGVLLVVGAVGIGDSFKAQVIGTITGSNLGDLQIHKRGYVNSMDTMPLDMNIPEAALGRAEETLDADPDVAASSRRIRFSAMASNFTETTNMRFTAVYPEDETAVCPDLTGRIREGNDDPASFVAPGSIVIPENVAAGMGLKVGSEIIVIANNREGSVNGLSLRVGAVAENIIGPQGKDGYMHVDDAAQLLQQEKPEITEIAVRLHDFNALTAAAARLEKALPRTRDGGDGKPVLEVHTWEELSPFASIANIVTLLLAVVRIVLVFIVVTSVLNVMIMSVYERVGEIGTIASIGTVPSKITALFLAESLILGLASALAGAALGSGLLLAVAAVRPGFVFGRMALELAPAVPAADLALTVAIVVCMTVLAGLQPAIKASRMQPVDALRHV